MSSIQLYDWKTKATDVAGTLTKQCKTVVLNAGDCINEITTYYGGYVEYLKIKTKLGFEYIVGGADSWKYS
jgi:hypothetical protein